MVQKGGSCSKSTAAPAWSLMTVEGTGLASEEAPTAGWLDKR